MGLIAAVLAMGGCSSGGKDTPATGGSGGAGGSSGSGGSGGITFTIPENGGPVDVTTDSGNVVHFEFPASASGRTVVLTPTSASAIGWPEGEFADVIDLSPDGVTFEEPVIVRTDNKSAVVLHFAGGSTKSVPEVLQ
ncbi:MAG TPA: hypothetical protein VK524_14625, partial [Polyangiaceae bacterium]|nr:hypothetical protein [Polyangiaceae bacterium]